MEEATTSARDPGPHRKENQERDGNSPEIPVVEPRGPGRRPKPKEGDREKEVDGDDDLRRASARSSSERPSHGTETR